MKIMIDMNSPDGNFVKTSEACKLFAPWFEERFH